MQNVNLYIHYVTYVRIGLYYDAVLLYGVQYNMQLLSEYFAPHYRAPTAGNVSRWQCSGGYSEGALP